MEALASREMEGAVGTGGMVRHRRRGLKECWALRRPAATTPMSGEGVGLVLAPVVLLRDCWGHFSSREDSSEEIEGRQPEEDEEDAQVRVVPVEGDCLDPVVVAAGSDICIYMSLYVHSLVRSGEFYISRC